MFYLFELYFIFIFSKFLKLTSDIRCQKSFSPILNFVYATHGVANCFPICRYLAMIIIGSLITVGLTLTVTSLVCKRMRRCPLYRERSSRCLNSEGVADRSRSPVISVLTHSMQAATMYRPVDTIPPKIYEGERSSMSSQDVSPGTHTLLARDFRPTSRGIRRETAQAITAAPGRRRVFPPATAAPPLPVPVQSRFSSFASARPGVLPRYATTNHLRALWQAEKASLGSISHCLVLTRALQE